MNRVLLAQVRANAGRLVASMTAIVIAVAFVVATLVLNQTAKSTVLEAVGAQYTGTDYVLSSTEGASLADQVEAVAAVPGVTAVAPAWDTSLQTVLPGTTGARYVAVGAVADAPALRWQQLSAGAFPTGPDQIALSAGSDVAVGDVLPFTTYDAQGTEVTGDLTVTGLVDVSGSVTGGLYTQGFVTPDQARQWGALAPELLISGDPDRVALQAAIETRAVMLQTGEEAAETAAAAITGGSDALAVVLLVFATVAVLVAGLVIANTFAVLLAQRTRELALLRCVGATAAQVRRSVLGEALVTGVAASVLGVLGGIGLAAAVSALASTFDSPIPLSGVSVPWIAVVAGLAVGVLTTVVAALAPARAATRVAPLAALRPTDAAPLRSRPGVLRLVLGLLLLVPGVALLAWGAAEHQVLVALPGGALSFLGAVLLAQRAVPPVVAAAGRVLGRVGGVPGRLAAGNATRNPRRTAATATALLIGVTLTTAMVVGASSSRATASAGLDAAYPTDVVVQDGGTGSLPASLLGQLEAVDGVQQGVAVDGGEVTAPDGQTYQVEGVDPAATAPVLRSTTDQPLPADGQVVLPPGLATQWGVEIGAPVTFTAGDRSLTATALAGSDDTWTPRFTTADLARLVPDAAPAAIWLRLDDDADAASAVEDVTEVAGTAVPTAYVTGIASERAAIDDVLDTLLLVVTGLLGVAVVIALIGVGNTLALSVVERRQESGLLRALGLTRGQLRGLLAWEAVLVAGVAAVLGVLLGGGYGLVGAASVLGSLSSAGTVVSIPWLQVAAIVVVATGAGLLASVLPARRAARTPPVAAIAA